MLFQVDSSMNRCGYVFSILVVDKSYVIKLLGLLIPSWIRFIYITLERSLRKQLWEG